MTRPVYVRAISRQDRLEVLEALFGDFVLLQELFLHLGDFDGVACRLFAFALLFNDAKAAVHGEPAGLLHLELLFDVRLDAVHVRLVLELQVDQEVNVVPHLVVLHFVRLETLLSLPDKGL